MTRQNNGALIALTSNEEFESIDYIGPKVLLWLRLKSLIPAILVVSITLLYISVPIVTGWLLYANKASISLHPRFVYLLYAFLGTTISMNVSVIGIEKARGAANSNFTTLLSKVGITLIIVVGLSIVFIMPSYLISGIPPVCYYISLSYFVEAVLITAISALVFLTRSTS